MATLEPGAVVFVDVEIRDGAGRPVSRPYTLSVDATDVAVIDASGRLRAVGPGTTRVRATSSVGEASAPIVVRDAAVELTLETLDGDALPLLVDADSVEWDGAREYHELWAVGGAFAIARTPELRYEVEIRYEQYRVTEVNGERVLELRARWREYDRGVLDYDAAGDLRLVSEVFSPLGHRATPVRGGLAVTYRIPGTDLHLDLRYAR